MLVFLKDYIFMRCLIKNCGYIQHIVKNNVIKKDIRNIINCTDKAITINNGKNTIKLLPSNQTLPEKEDINNLYILTPENYNLSVLTNIYELRKDIVFLFQKTYKDGLDVLLTQEGMIYELDYTEENPEETYINIFNKITADVYLYDENKYILFLKEHIDEVVKINYEFKEIIKLNNLINVKKVNNFFSGNLKINEGNNYYLVTKEIAEYFHTRIDLIFPYVKRTVYSTRNKTIIATSLFCIY
jgi:hypothetical protein